MRVICVGWVSHDRRCQLHLEIVSDRLAVCVALQQLNWTTMHGWTMQRPQGPAAMQGARNGSSHAVIEFQGPTHLAQQKSQVPSP